MTRLTKDNLRNAADAMGDVLVLGDRVVYSGTYRMNKATVLGFHEAADKAYIAIIDPANDVYNGYQIGCVYIETQRLVIVTGREECFKGYTTFDTYVFTKDLVKERRDAFYETQRKERLEWEKRRNKHLQASGCSVT